MVDLEYVDNFLEFLEAAKCKKPLERLLWLYENESGDCEDIAKRHPELNEVVVEIANRIKKLGPEFKAINKLIRRVERVSPKK